MPNVEPVTVAGTWWRHVPVGGDPLWRPPHPADGRWQRGDVVAGYYLADEPDTAWAEWYRALAEVALPPDESLPRDLWPCDVDRTVADLSTPARLSAVGLAPPSPHRAEWPDYQRTGEQLHAAGWAGLLAPSAARPARRVLCLFRPGEHLDGATLLPPPTRVDHAPPPPRGMTT